MSRQLPPDHRGFQAIAGLTTRRKKKGQPVSWSTSGECTCCGRIGTPLSPLRQTDKGWRCGGDFCRLGTSAEEDR